LEKGNKKHQEKEFEEKKKSSFYHILINLSTKCLKFYAFIIFSLSIKERRTLVSIKNYYTNHHLIKLKNVMVHLQLKHN
jgi:hypothetical protein